MAIWLFQLRSFVNERPSRMTLPLGVKISPSKMMSGFKGGFLREKVMLWVFELLNLTELARPHWEILAMSSFKESTMDWRDSFTWPGRGYLEKVLELCRVESSA